MSRYDADLTAAAETTVAMDELLGALGGIVSGADRYWAMAQYISGGEGWRDAGNLLRGTFAGFVPAAAGQEGSTRGEKE